MTSNGLLDVPPTSSNVTCTNPVSSEPVYCVWLNCTVISSNYNDCNDIFIKINVLSLLEESSIVPVTLVMDPTLTLPWCDDGTFLNLILALNISSPSTIVSFITGTLTVVEVSPAGILTVSRVEIKSFRPIICDKYCTVENYILHYLLQILHTSQYAH